MTDPTLPAQLAAARERGDGPEAARLERAIAAQVPAPRAVRKLGGRLPATDEFLDDAAAWRAATDAFRSSSAHLLVDVANNTVRQYLPVDPPEPPPLPAQVLEDARRIIDDPTPRQPSYGLRRRTPDELNDAEEAFVRQHFAAGTVVNSAALSGALKLAGTPAAVATGRGLLARALEPHAAPRSEALFGVVDELAPLDDATFRRLLAIGGSGNGSASLAREQAERLGRAASAIAAGDALLLAAVQHRLKALEGATTVSDLDLRDDLLDLERVLTRRLET